MTDHHDIVPPDSGEPRDPEIERLARPLRAAETLSPAFDARLMAAVRAAPRPRRAPTRVLHLSTPAALAAAAAIAVAAFLGGRASVGGSAEATGARAVPSERVASLPAAATPASPGHDTVHVVRFVFIAPSAASVTLVGDFNDWDRAATPLRPTGAGGAWSVSVALQPGRHEYAFIVNGRTWTADPSTPLTVHDDFGTTSSILTVGARAG